MISIATSIDLRNNINRKKCPTSLILRVSVCWVAGRLVARYLQLLSGLARFETAEIIGKGVQQAGWVERKDNNALKPIY